MLIEPGQYGWKKFNDAQINYFFHFLQHDGVMQDVASGTQSVKISSGRRTNNLDAMRMVHKSEAIRLYIGACNKECNTQESDCPFEGTLWNILNTCPAPQRKSIAGFNVASEGSDAFDEPNPLCNWLKATVKKYHWKHWLIAEDTKKGDYNISHGNQQQQSAMPS